MPNSTYNMTSPNAAKPFVKWVGGKTQLLHEVQKALPKDFSSLRNVTYVEPFVGGGAVLFWVLQNYPNVERAVINDINAELISTYKAVKSDVLALKGLLSSFEAEYLPLSHEARTEYFLKKRERFNSVRSSDLETAALFIFLNRTCFNGLYRVNSKGDFNVPHGRYKNPKICDAENLNAVSNLLQRVEILHGDFVDTERYASPTSLYYLDPPYKPITETSSFTSYSVGGFNDDEQIRLRNFCTTISKKGALFIASNSDPKGVNPNDTFLDEIYSQFNIKRVRASRMINANPNGRGDVNELIISNVSNTTI